MSYFDQVSCNDLDRIENLLDTEDYRITTPISPSKVQDKYDMTTTLNLFGSSQSDRGPLIIVFSLNEYMVHI